MKRLLTAICALSILLLTTSPGWAGRLLEVHFIKVGQGDGMLIKTPSGRNILVDAGPPEAGRRLVRYLRNKAKVPLIHLAMISHPHLDHYGGMFRVLKGVKVKRYMDPGFAYASPTYKKLLRRLRKKRIPFLKGKSGQVLRLGGGVILRLIGPTMPFVKDSRSDANANSIVFRLEYKKLRILFTGDAEAETESRLLRRPDRLPAQILKVAHHGSRHASATRFLKATQAKVAIISCGAGNRYGHPHKATLRRLMYSGMKVYSTHQKGDIIVRSNGRKVWISTRGRSRSRASQVFELAIPKSLSKKELKKYAGHNQKDLKVVKRQKYLVAQPEKSGWLTKPQGKMKKYRYSKAPKAKGYVANRRSRVFHRKSCRFAKLLRRRKRIRFRTRRAALKSRRRPASCCRP